jgi:ABC-type Zn uptake system ZnuABC Zn-binding protein ZnuA
LISARFVALVALGALSAAAPQPAAAADQLRVVTTTADLAALVKAVGGARVEVESLAAPEQDAHAIEIKPGQLARLQRADLIVKIGLDHEPWLARVPAPPVPAVDTSQSVSLLQTETPRLRVERKAHVHAYGNTHFWLDPENARPITAAILAALVALRPADESAFQANRADFLGRLDERLKAWEEALRPYRGIRVVVVHDSWSYFAARFGIEIVAAAEPQPGVPPSPAELAALYAHMREAKVPLLIADPYANPALIRQVAEKGGARPVVLMPSGYDYLGLFEENVRRLVEALKG